METEAAKELLRRRDLGRIDEKVCILYGVSGTIPYKHPTDNRDLSPKERMEILQRRMESKFGDNWRDYFSEIPLWLDSDDDSWIHEGF